MSKFKKLILSTLALGFLSITPTIVNINQAAALVDTPWGPNRTTFTWEDPAPYATFNSITNNPDVGDERNFVRIREVKDGSNFGDEVQLEMGKTYEVYIYYHNNADAHDVGQTAIGIADGAAVKSSFPAIVRKDERATVTGTVFASDTNPLAVWDGAYMTATRDLYLRYVPDTAIIHNGGALNGEHIGPDYLFGDGALLGYNRLSGILPGCNQYAGYITYQIFADAPDFTIEKSIVGGSSTVKAGDEVTFKIRYENTGTMDQLRVVARDTLPENLVYVPGSTMLYNNNFTNGKAVNDDLITENGMNIGDYAGGSGWAELVYKTRVSESARCNDRLTNSAIISTTDGNKTAEVTLNVISGCEPTPDPTPDPEPEEPPHGSLKKTASRTIITANEEVEFRLTIKNTGSTELKNVVVKDALPAGLTFVNDSARLFGNGSATSIKVPDSLVTTGYRIASINAGRTFYITYRAKASGDFDCEGTTITNTATITYDNIQSSDSSNTTASTTIKARRTDGCDEPEPGPGNPSAEIKKTASKTSATINEEIEFKLVIKNTGSVNLTNVVIKDALPTGLTFIGGSAKLSSEGSDVVTDVPDEIAATGYNLGELAIGKTITITYRAKTDDGFDCTGSSITNTATLTYDGSQASGRTASSTVTVKRVNDCNKPVDPEEDRPTEIVQTGPLEITLAVMVIAAIASAGGYYWYTHRTLKTVENKVSGKGPEPSDPKNDAE